MKSKMTRMLEHLKKHPKQKYGQLQTTLYNLDRKKSEQVVKAPTGWSCNNLRTIISRGVIAKDKDRLWILTKYGEKKINKPYSFDIEDRYNNLERMYEKQEERNSRLSAELYKLLEFKNKFKSLVKLVIEEDLWN